MTVLGVIAEYNPFHNGHLYHLETSRRLCPADYAVVVLSGGFVQRGEPAIVHKAVRVEAALRAGADLVIELPVCYATASAEYFARAAVRLLDSLGIVTHMSFGVEYGGLDELLSISDRILAAQSQANYQDLLRRYLSQGLPYFTAHEKTLLYILRIDRNFIRQPNHILAIEYIKALKRIQSPIAPLAVTRADTPCAIEIRAAITRGEQDFVKQSMPASAYAALRNALDQFGASSLNGYSTIFQYLIKTIEPSDLAEILDITEGLENRFIKCAGQHESLTDILAAAKTKRYPLTKLQRAALHLILNIRRDEFFRFNQLGGPLYIRVLGFRKESAGLLRAIEKNASLPMITSCKCAEATLDQNASAMLRKDIAATDIFYLSCENQKNIPAHRHEYRAPIIKL